jgi:hypothetical protein
MTDRLPVNLIAALVGLVLLGLAGWVFGAPVELA